MRKGLEEGLKNWSQTSKNRVIAHLPSKSITLNKKFPSVNIIMQIETSFKNNFERRFLYETDRADNKQY